MDLGRTTELQISAHIPLHLCLFIYAHVLQMKCEACSAMARVQGRQAPKHNILSITRKLMCMPIPEDSEVSKCSDCPVSQPRCPGHLYVKGQCREMVSVAEFSEAWVRGCFPSLTNSSCHNAYKPLTQKQMHKELASHSEH